jgi:arylsulfatase A-like enzyme
VYWVRCIALLVFCLACSLEGGTQEPALSVEEPLHRLLARVDPEDPWREVKRRAGDEYRNVLFTSEGGKPAGGYRSPRIRVPAGASLDFGIAVAGAAAPGRRAHFQVEAEHAAGRKVLFSRDLHRAEGWIDTRVDLGELANREVRFVFRSQWLDAAEAGAGAGRPVWSNPLLVSSGGTRRREAPNLVLISLDTLRADHLGAYGYERPTSPNLDRFMEEGILFERAFAPSSWTTPSHASVFTGHHPLVHGAGGPRGFRLEGRFSTLAELARRQGYQTAAFTEGAAVAGQLGFYQGFEAYANGTMQSPRPMATAEKTFSRAMAWLERHGALPFLLFVHTYEIHWPYRAPAPYAQMFTGEGMAVLTPGQVSDAFFIRSKLDESQKASMEAAYDEGIAYTDAVVGSFLDGLRREGLLANTIVVIFSDHGEAFWEHGDTLHGLTLYDEQLHVPLFIRLPGEHPPQARIERQVALVDVFPTLAELLGFEHEAPAYSQSLRPLWNPDDAAGTYDRALITGELVQQQAGAKWVMLSARNDDFKYIATTRYGHEESPLFPHRDALGDPETKAEQILMEHLLSGGRDVRKAKDEAERRRMFLSAREQLFELRSDPGESRDLVLQELENLRAMQRALHSELVRLEVDRERAGGPMEPVVPLTDEERAELRALGYIQ